MNYVDSIIRKNPEVKIAVIDKDEPGGICLTRGYSQLDRRLLRDCIHSVDDDIERIAIKAATAER